MFYHIEGTVTELEPNLVVLDCSGVGYALNATMNTVSYIHMGDKVKLYVAEAIGENNFDLYGFYTKGEKRCFELLVSVSGIGPKAALSILSYSTPETLALAIMNDDVKALTVAPGVGKKIAQRVILELKDKMSKETAGQEIRLPAAVPVTGQSDTMGDAMAALAVLGYSSAEIAPALKKIDVTGMSAEEIIKAVLKQMVK
ncbi:MAG: Holliday junction branch migration protein RuvA [Candidatus Limivicinus sp.]